MFTIYSKEKCQQCDSAKLLCQMKSVEYVVKMLGVDFDKEQLLEIAPAARSFPIVFRWDEFIGGLKELQEILCSDSM